MVRLRHMWPEMVELREHVERVRDAQRKEPHYAEDDDFERRANAPDNERLGHGRFAKRYESGRWVVEDGWTAEELAILDARIAEDRAAEQQI